MKTRKLIIEEATGGWILEILDWNIDEKCWDSNQRRIVVVSQYDLVQEVKKFYVSEGFMPSGYEEGK